MAVSLKKHRKRVLFLLKNTVGEKEEVQNKLQLLFADIPMKFKQL